MFGRQTVASVILDLFGLQFCRGGNENLCPDFRATTGRDALRPPGAGMRRVAIAAVGRSDETIPKSSTHPFSGF